MNTAPVPKGAETQNPQVEGADPKPQAPVVVEPTREELLVQALNDTDLTLQKANDEIVRLKKEAKESGNPNVNNDQIFELNKTIDGLKSDIETLKKGSVSREEVAPLIDEIGAVRKKNSELVNTIISKDTTGAGEGQGGHQPTPIAAEKPVEGDADKAVLDRMRARRIAEGRDPETGLKIKS